MKSIALVSTNFNVIYKDPDDKIDTISFSDKASLLDYDIVVIGINKNIIDEYYTGYDKYAGYKLIGETYSAKIIADIQRRKDEIKSLLSVGKNVYFVLGDEFTCYYHTYEKRVSGTGRNAQVTNIVKELNIADYVLGTKIETTYAEGKNIAILPNTKLYNFFNKTKKHIYYKSYFKSTSFEPLLTTVNQDNYISGILKYDKGYKIILPEFVNPKLYNSKETRKRLNDVDFIIQSIRELDSNLTSDCEIPSWISQYGLSNEAKEIIENHSISKKIEKLKEKQSKILSKLNDNFKYKKLLYSTGTELEEIVKEVFEEMGFELLKSRPNRSDVNLKIDDNYFVCEVKGLSKSATEKNASQLQKWETEFYEDFEVHPKQILLVNAFRLISLKERTENAFPDQMVGYATKKEQCLMTTTQLLCLYLDWLNNNNALINFIEEVNKTNGILLKYQNSNEFIDLIENMTNVK